VNTAPERSVRFSAVIVPLCASMICLLMARPSPEWSPKSRPRAGRYRSAGRCGRCRRGCPAPRRHRHDDGVFIGRLHRHVHRAALGRERHRVVDQVGEHLRQPAVLPHGDRRVPARCACRARPRCRGSPRHRAGSTPWSRPASRHPRARRRARQFGIEPAGIGDVRDQPVEPAHVVLDDGVQPLAILGPRARAASPPPSAARSAGS
jgi:hypothetical protein